MKNRAMMAAFGVAFVFVLAACFGSLFTSRHMAQTAAMQDSSSGGSGEKKPNLLPDQPQPPPQPETTGSAVPPAR